MIKLDQEFFTDILRKFEEDTSISVETVLKNDACEAGNNFVAVVSRVTLIGVKNCKDHQWFLIAKEFQKDCFFDAKQAFFNEVYAYRHIIPTLSEYNSRQFPFPKCLYSSPELIILEDLSRDGFKNVDKFVGLDYECIKSVVKELANLHSASIVLNKKNPAKFKELSTIVKELAFSSEKSEVMDTQEWNIAKGIALLKNTITIKNSEEYTKFIQILEYIKGKTYEMQRKILSKPREILVINHGDCWCNNILVRDKEVKLIDFQLMRTTSVAADLSYFLYVNMEPNLRISKQNELLGVYLTELNKCLKLGNVDIQLTRSWLDDEMAEFSIFGYLHGMWFLPLFLEKCLPEMRNKAIEEMEPEILNRILIFTKEYANIMIKKKSIFKHFDNLDVTKEKKIINYNTIY